MTFSPGKMSTSWETILKSKCATVNMSTLQINRFSLQSNKAKKKTTTTTTWKSLRSVNLSYSPLHITSPRCFFPMLLWWSWSDPKPQAAQTGSSKRWRVGVRKGRRLAGAIQVPLGGWNVTWKNVKSVLGFLKSLGRKRCWGFAFVRMFFFLGKTKKREMKTFPRRVDHILGPNLFNNHGLSEKKWHLDPKSSFSIGSQFNHASHAAPKNTTSSHQERVVTMLRCDASNVFAKTEWSASSSDVNFNCRFLIKLSTTIAYILCCKSIAAFW